MTNRLFPKILLLVLLYVMSDVKRAVCRNVQTTIARMGRAACLTWHSRGGGISFLFIPIYTKNMSQNRNVISILGSIFNILSLTVDMSNMKANRPYLEI